MNAGTATENVLQETRHLTVSSADHDGVSGGGTATMPEACDARREGLGKRLTGLPDDQLWEYYTMKKWGCQAGM